MSLELSLQSVSLFEELPLLSSKAPLWPQRGWLQQSHLPPKPSHGSTGDDIEELVRVGCGGGKVGAAAPALRCSCRRLLGGSSCTGSSDPLD